MKQTYTVVVKQNANWWIGWVEEVPGVNCQESTREELLSACEVGNPMPQYAMIICVSFECF